MDTVHCAYLGMEHPQEILRKFTPADIKGHRDSEWIVKEKSYHDTSISKLNALVWNYNGVAPYAVRRAYYTREVEIENLYKDCAPAILQAIAERGQRRVPYTLDLRMMSVLVHQVVP